VRLAGKVPTESEVSELLKEVGPEKIDVNKVKLLLEKAKREIDDKEVREALKLFDPDNKGTIQTDQLKTVLTSMGERLDAKDLDPVLQQLDQDGFINIEKLMGILMPRAGGN
jgi:calmodulin